MRRRDGSWTRLRTHALVLTVAASILAAVIAGLLLPAGSEAATTAQADDWVIDHLAVPGSWRDLTADARALGVSRLYATYAHGPFRYGPRDGVWYVGTYGTKCLISVGYSNVYTEYALAGIPKLSVQVFNRYGKPSFLEGNDALRYSAVRGFLRPYSKRCV